MSDEFRNALEQPKRRRFVEVFLGAGVVASLASFLYPVLRYLLPPETAEASSDTVLAGRGAVRHAGTRPH